MQMIIRVFHLGNSNFKLRFVSEAKGFYSGQQYVCA